MFAREIQSTFGGARVGALLGSVSATLTAAGTSQATATAVTTVFTNVTTATEGQGVVLPTAMNPGDKGVVCNATTVSIYVYPPVGGQINGATANIPVMVPPNTAATFVYSTGLNVMVAR